MMISLMMDIKQAIQDLFNNIKAFVEGNSLDYILDIGTSIVQSICDGILAAEEDGTLYDTIDSFIKKISNWIIDNGPKVQKVGTAILEALKEGIDNNEALIESAMDVICDIIVEWTDKSKSLEAAAGKFAQQFISLAFDNFINGIKNWLKEKGGMIWDIFSEPGEFDWADLFIWDFSSVPGPAGVAGKWGKALGEAIFGKDPVGDVMAWFKEKFSGFHPIQAVKDWFTGETYADSGEEGTLIDGQPKEMKSNTKTTEKLEQVDVETLVNIDTAELTEVEDALVKLETAAQKAANTMRTEFVNMTNIARNQMLNISNIIRNQAINWANIIRNQAKNARDGFTQQMISMASVARTQMVNISNIIRNQSLSWYNIINNQAKNARDAFTRQMMSMVAVARNQMYNVLSTVRSYMSQITGATNKSISLNVGQSGGSATLPTTPALAMADALYAANAASTYSLDASGISSRASSASSNNSSASYGSSEANIIHTHVYLEGREIAKASAKYMNSEIKAINKRENRKRGVK